MTTPHVFNTHRQAVLHMTLFYLDMSGYKLHKPKSCIDSTEIFCVASKDDGLIISLLENKTIAKQDGYGNSRGLVTTKEYEAQRDIIYDVLSA